MFIAHVGFQFFSPFLTVYVRELGVTDRASIALWSGALSAVTPAVSGLLSPLFGRLADRFGRKMMLIRSLAGFTVIIGAMGLVTSVRQLLVARFLQGLFAGFSPMAMALASVSAPRDKVSVAIGRVQAAQLLSVAIGPLAGGLVASHLGTRAAFYATSALCAVALVTLIFLFQEHEAAPEPGAAPRRRHATPLKQFVRYPHFLLVMALLFVAQFIDRGLALLVPLRVARLPGVTEIAATSGLIISIAAVIAAGSASLAARLSLAMPPGQLLLLQFALGGPMCAAMALAGHWGTLALARALVAICIGGALTVAYSLGGTIMPPETRGVAFGWLALGVQIGTAVSPLVSGAVAAISLSRAFVVDACLAWAGAALLLLTARDLLTRRERLAA